VAFEVIEHLENWRGFLSEARRVLTGGGQFVVSTPNKRYYTESRGAEGANPFHVHEFDFEEFRAELQAIYPQVSMFLENHVEGVTFQPCAGLGTAEARVDGGQPSPEESHFFVAVCGHQPQAPSAGFVYIPRTANVLRERERHIALLEGELDTKNQWLQKALEEHRALMTLFEEQKAALDRSNQWAETQNREIEKNRARIAELQAELESEQAAAIATTAAYEAKVADLERDVEDKTQWARDTETRLTAEVQKQTADLVSAVDALHRTEKDLEERTAWALRAQKEADDLAQQIALVRSSRWVKLGRKVGLGPVLPHA
jgi:hypothetical protein